MRVCILPQEGRLGGGPKSFLKKLSGGLQSRGVFVSADAWDGQFDAALIINCPTKRELAGLLRLKMKGVRIVQRLGIPNYLHRFLKLGFSGALKETYWNTLISFIRARVADHIVYQTAFSRSMWNKGFGIAKAQYSVIYNGVDLASFAANGDKYHTNKELCILSVEGTQGMDPFDILERFTKYLQGNITIPFEILVFGDLAYSFKSTGSNHLPNIKFKGHVPNVKLPYYYRGATLYLLTDIITAACPNTVIESLACGCPVLGYNIGPMPELVTESAGRLLSCDDDPFAKQDPGNFEGMAKAVAEIQAHREKFSKGARALAEDRYSLDMMVDAYLNVLRGSN